MKKVFRGNPIDISKDIKEWLEQIGCSESENTEAYQEIIVEILDK